MRRGEIRLADLAPSRGSEADELRPVVRVSNDGSNSTAERLGRGVVTVVPVTSNTAHVAPFQVFLAAKDTGLNLDSKAQAEQVRSIGVQRIGRVIGRLTSPQSLSLDDALRVHLLL